MIHLLLLLATVHSVYAFDVLPEYQGLSERELQRFEIPSEIDSEYQSAVNAYTTSLDWERKFQGSKKALDLSIGSLSNKHFLHYHRLKLETDLTESLSFHLNSFGQRDREVDQVRNVLELSQRLTNSLRLNVFGEPSLYKRENDMGFALLTASAHWQNRIYYILHDFTRKDHNDQADRFKGQEPHSLGWSSVWDSEKLWSRFGFRLDRPVEWLRPQEERVFHFGKKQAYADFAWSLSEFRHMNLRLQWDTTYKSQGPDSPTSPIVEEAWNLERHFARLGYQSGSENDEFSYEIAWMHARREWTNFSGRKFAHNNELPSATAKLKGLRDDHSDHILLGLELNIFNMYGDRTLTSPLQKTNSVEQRLQTAYEFKFKNNAILTLALNFDLDEWRTTPTFEGGNGQFRAEF